MTGATPPSTSLVPEPGSFRDWDGRVFSADGRVLRALTATGVAEWTALASSDLCERYTRRGELVETTAASAETLERLRAADPSGEWAGALSHERLPFVSYPYEWPFSMLRDAALLQLRLTSDALAEGLMLKDATPYNVQWRGAQPVFIDVGSFERARPGEPWAAYRQFCSLYLYPLMLEAYRGVPFQPLLRGKVEGIAPLELRPLFGVRDWLRPGVLRHVVLHAGLERRHGAGGANVRDELRAAGFDQKLVEANVRQMTRLVRRLGQRARASPWRGYRVTCGYTEAETLAKDDFVRRAVARRPRRLVWDLGCNDGRHSRIAAAHASFTVAVDADPVTVDALYAVLRDEGERSILPLVVDVADPSPGLGWRNRERLTLEERGAPDLVLCLALLHHLAISRNVPLRVLVDWLRGLDCEVVVEFVDRDDPMVARLLAGKRDDAHPDYERRTFEEELRRSFEVADALELASGRRALYLVRPR